MIIRACGIRLSTVSGDVFVNHVRCLLQPVLPCRFVVFGFGQFDKVKGVLQALADFIEAVDDACQRGAFLAEFGRFFGIVPDGGALQLAFDFFEAFGFYGVVKDTP